MSGTGPTWPFPCPTSWEESAAAANQPFQLVLREKGSAHEQFVRYSIASTTEDNGVPLQYLMVVHSHHGPHGHPGPHKFMHQE